MTLFRFKNTNVYLKKNYTYENFDAIRIQGRIWRALRKQKLNDNKTVWRIFFHQHCIKTEANTEMAFRFWLAAYVVRLFDSHFSLVYFIGLKYILARQILLLIP